MRSLLGLFSVQMPMLYGEGKQAFVRLQEEIIKSTDDHTIFAWQTDGSVDTHGLLAESPLAFAASSECSSPRTWMKATPFAMTNMGLRIELPLLPVVPVEVDDRTSEPTFDAILPCTLPSNPNKFVAIRVRALPGLTNKWTRIECNKFYYKDSISWPIELYFPQSIPDTTMTPETPSIYEIVRLRSFAIDNPGLSGTFQHLHIWRVATENIPKIASSGAFKQFDHGRIPATHQLLHRALGRAGSNSGPNDNQFCVVGAARGRVYGWFILERVSNATEVMVIVGRHMTGQIGFGVLWCLHRPSGRSPLEQDLCQLQVAGSWMDMEVYCEADDTSWSRSNLERRVAANRVRRVPLRRAKVDMHSEPHGRFYDFSVQLA
ncbi:hypothetical protein PRZ48_009821 [Zasmidium cellare]|uniref:DUF8212 domain-containing protein n=1 Tax=Zasmidium cellare TaxID=395010 RepID=A0ABR0EDN8_ZASCE|nr:hypothetical protein PRZ48_009821 [Zasmidium cellare]